MIFMTEREAEGRARELNESPSARAHYYQHLKYLLKGVADFGASPPPPPATIPASHVANGELAAIDTESPTPSVTPSSVTDIKPHPTVPAIVPGPPSPSSTELVDRVPPSSPVRPQTALPAQSLTGGDIARLVNAPPPPPMVLTPPSGIQVVGGPMGAYVVRGPPPPPPVLPPHPSESTGLHKRRRDAEADGAARPSKRAVSFKPPPPTGGAAGR